MIADMNFTVTDNAMRPASDCRECFYCHQPVGSTHKDDCVLIRKKVKVRMTAEYEVEVPHWWGKEMIEFERNDGSWCATNAIEELEELAEEQENRCLCEHIHFDCVDDRGVKYLKE